MGAPIYLVSACTSGEEFIAAFRRYADKNGLFIPIGEPLPPGSRSRFAVTLRDGGVMIEGEAEIVSAARTPSVLHGRVGMTLRFVAPDDASKITLGELERARLSMKPPPPSVPPRPADVPAEPRPLPPPIQGRIDAVNALAECVAIGDVAALGPPLPPAAAAPARSGPRLGSPTAPPPASPPGASTAPAAPVSRAPSPTQLPGLGVAPAAPGAQRPPTVPPPIGLGRGDARAEPARDAAPPAITPRATPLSDRLRSAERAPIATVIAAAPPAAAAVRTATAAPPAPAPVTGASQTLTAIAIPPPGPTSDTMVAAIPPPPPSAETRADRIEKGPISATINAVPIATAHPPSAPTEIGGALVVPIFADEDTSARTQIHAGAPRPPGDAAPAAPGRSGAFAPAVTMSGLPPMRLPAPRPADLEIAEPTDISMPPEPPSTPSTRLTAEGPSTEPEAEPLVARPSTDELIAEAAAEAEAAAAPAAAAPEVEPGAPGRPRRTVVGVAVMPSGVLVPPAFPAPRAPPELDGAATTDDDEATGHARITAAPDDDEATRHARITVGDAAVDAGAPTIPPSAEIIAAAPDEPTQHAGWAPQPAAAAPVPLAPRAVNSKGLPSGDWMIALDPSAPDGWSSPFHALPRPDGEAGAAAPPTAPGTGRPPPMSPVAMAVSMPGEPAEQTPIPGRPGEMAAVEPKVQIDPTLIEPLHSVVDGAPATASSPGPAELQDPLPPTMAMYASSPGHEAVEGPPLQMMMAVPQPGPFVPHPQHAMHPGHVPGHVPGHGPGQLSGHGPGHLPGHPGHPPGYAMDPGYPMVPMQSGMVTADGSGFGEVRYPIDRSHVRRRGLIIALVIAVAAVLIGIAATLALRGARAPGPSSAPPVAKPPAAVAPSAPSPPAAAAPPSAGSAASAAPAPAGSDPATPPAAAAAAPAAPAAACFAEVVSQPAGAEIVRDQTTVIGTTPQRVALPCGAPVELLIRKGRLVPVTRTVTPTPTGAPLQVALVRQTVLVRVSSTPTGATVTLGGKSLGVTPTMVKVPAFEASLLAIAKDGYETETERVAPRTNGSSVHAVLKKSDRKRPR